MLNEYIDNYLAPSEYGADQPDDYENNCDHQQDVNETAPAKNEKTQCP
jgi:hypothetical protein